MLFLKWLLSTNGYILGYMHGYIKFYPEWLYLRYKITARGGYHVQN